MKKILILAIISILAIFFTVHNIFAEGIGGTAKIGIDFEGDHEVSGYGLSGTEDVETGVSFSAELFAKIGYNLDLGGGITVQVPRSQKDFEGDFYFIPIYGAIRARFEAGNVTPYFIGQAGYNFFDGDSDYKGYGPYEVDLEGGLYWGLGGGVIINKHFLIELLYSVNNGTVKDYGYEFDIEYSKVTLNIGYNF
jgi:hypothetical protein